MNNKKNIVRSSVRDNEKHESNVMTLYSVHLYYTVTQYRTFSSITTVAFIIPLFMSCYSYSFSLLLSFFIIFFFFFFVAFFFFFFFFFQAEDGIRDYKVTGVQTCALPI